MNKLTFASVLMLSTAIFISCSPVLNEHPSFATKQQTKPLVEFTPYGAYLSGRVAHLRKDFDSASQFYKIALQEDSENPELINKLYMLLTSKGKIDEAVVYAKKALEQKRGNDFTKIIVATSLMKEQNYSESLKVIENLKEPLYKELLKPIVSAWNYAGMKNEKKAVDELKKLKKTTGLEALYTPQYALIMDYLGKNREAGDAYNDILADKNSEISVRLIEIITNFKIRTSQIKSAEAMLKSTTSHPTLKIIITQLLERLNNSKNPPKAILENPGIGLAEALLSIASSFKYDDVIDVAHMFTALTLYLSPDYSTAKILMADIFESHEMYQDANKLYDSISSKDITYYPSQLKKARNFVKQKDFLRAEQLLKKMAKSYDDAQIYMDLGDILRVNNRYSEAIKYYDKAITQTSDKNILWMLHYAKGAALEQSGLWEKAEKSMMKAYELKKHYLIMNYLGYSWMKQNHNINQAFSMIVDAYNQAPFDPSINDSLGYALYKLGYYTMSLPYLERATEMFPSSAVITSHLGDAYWFAHRKNEAVFQWKHALKLKDDSNELKKEDILNKIENGIKEEPSLTFDKEQIEETIKKIKRIKPFRSL